MRGKVTDIDLTNYALNELPPEERLYVESILGVSEECRNDVYQMLEFSEMLKDGYELQEQQALLALDESQRSKVLTVSRWNFRGFLRQAAAVALLAVGTTYALMHPALWHQAGTVKNLATASEAVGTFMADVRKKGFAQTAEEFTARIQGAKAANSGENQLVSAPAECTPPAWQGMPVIADISEM